MVINNAGTDVGLKINSTSSGNILQLQDGGVDKVVVADGGNTTFSGDVTTTGDLIVDTDTLKVDASGNKVGIGTATVDEIHLKGTEDRN